MFKNKYLIFVLTLVVILFNLFIYIEKKPLIHEEPRRAIVAQEMLLSGNYIVPTVYSKPYLKKPPLQNWLIAILGFEDRYVSNFDARFPSVIALILIGFSMLIFIEDKKIAITSSFVAMTNYLMLYSYGNKSEPDLLLTLFTLLSYLFYIKSPKNFKFIIVSSIFMGLGILTKGVSPLFFYPGIIVYLLLHKRNQFYSYLKFLLLHLLLSLILPIFWIILYYYNGNISDLITVFSSEATSRAKGGIGKVVTHFLVFPLQIFLALFPWSILLFFYKKFSFKTKNDLFNSSLIIFIVSFLIMAILPGGRGRYFMPAVPFFAMSISHLLNDDFNHNISWNKYISYLLATIFVISAGFLIYNKAYIQILIIFIGFLLFIFLVKNTKSVVYLLLFVNLLGFTIFTNTYEYYRATNYYNYKEAAKKVITSLNEDLPLVVDTSINPIQLLFNYERMSKKLVYSSAVNTFKKYYFVTNKNSKECQKVFELKYPKKRLKKIFFYECKK